MSNFSNCVQRINDRFKLSSQLLWSVYNNEHIERYTRVLLCYSYLNLDGIINWFFPGKRELCIAIEVLGGEINVFID